MERVSIRTLSLMVVLLLAVVAIQCVTPAKPARASAVWLAGNSPQNTSTPCEASDCNIT